MIFYYISHLFHKVNQGSMSDIQQLEDCNISFEDFKNQNGITYWWASDMMSMLGYPNMKSFQKVLDRATKALVSLNIPHYDNIITFKREINGIEQVDFKLTRFACYLVAMNADPKKPEVARAQAYFIQQTRMFEIYIQDSNQLDRILIREELIEGNKSLSSVAKNAGVTDFAKFQNAGYLGMYNMYNWQLAKKRGLDSSKLIDNMGRTELAANLFRVTQTEEYIKNHNIKGQAKLEDAHKYVGTEVRKLVIKNTGKRPEELPQERQLPEVKKDLKKGYREMQKIDKKKK